MRCNNCGREAATGDVFCSECGMMLPKRRGIERFFIAAIKSLCYFLLFFGMQVAVLFICSFVLSMKYMSGIPSYDCIPGASAEERESAYMAAYLSWVHIAVIISVLLTVLFLIIFFRLRKKRLSGEIALKPISLANYPLMLILGMSLQFVTILILTFIPIPEAFLNEHTESYEVISNGPMWLQVLDVALLTPIMEEIIFRGLIFTRIRKYLPDMAAVILSSLIFGIAHGTLYAFIYATVFGIFLALFYKAAGSVIAPILCHAGFNGASILISALNLQNGIIIFRICILSVCATVALTFLTLEIEKRKGNKKENEQPIQAL